MKPLKSHQQCKALQIRKQKSRKVKTLETAQIEEQLLEDHTHFQQGIKQPSIFACTQPPPPVKEMKLQFWAYSHHTATQPFYTADPLPVCISSKKKLLKKKITKHPCQCQHQSWKGWQNEGNATQLIARQVWDEWYQGQAEFEVRSSMTKMTIVTKRGKKGTEAAKTFARDIGDNWEQKASHLNCQ